MRTTTFGFALLFLLTFLNSHAQEAQPLPTQLELPARIFTFHTGGQHYKSVIAYDFVDQELSHQIRLRSMAGIGFRYDESSYFIFSAGLQYKKDSTMSPITVYSGNSVHRGQAREGYSILMPAFNLTHRKYFLTQGFPLAFFYQAFLDVSLGKGKGRMERDLDVQWTEFEQRLGSKGSEFEMFVGLNLGFAYFVSSNFSVEVSTGFLGYHRKRRTIEYTDLTNRKFIGSGMRADFLHAGLALSTSYFF